MQALSRLTGKPRQVSTVIFLLACLLYANTIPNKWAIDDGLIIHNSNAVRLGFRGIPALLGGDFLESSTGEKIDAVAGSRYRPLTPVIFASLAGIVALPATDTRGNPLTDRNGVPLLDLGEHTIFPQVLHLLNVLAYAILCVVLYRVLLLMFGGSGRGALVAFLAALFYTVHPLHTEAVANAKGLDEILAMLFALLALRTALLATDAKGTRFRHVIASAAFLFLACLSKENAITFMVIIPLAILAFRGLGRGSMARIYSPLLISAGLYLGLRTVAVGSFALRAPDPVNMMNNPFLMVAEGQRFVPLLQGSEFSVLERPGMQSIVAMPLEHRFATVSYAWLQYLKLFAAPVDLSYDYYPKQIDVRGMSDPAVLFSLLLHAAALIWAIVNIRRRRVPAFAILYYFISFSIVSNLLIPVGTNMAERFLFMPSAGLCMIAAYAITCLLERLPEKAVGAACLLAISLLVVRTVVRNADWKDNFTLISHDLKIATNSAKIRSDYGEVVLKELAGTRAGAYSAEQIGLLRLTLPLYAEALEVYPMYGLVWFNLARTNHILGESELISPVDRLGFLRTAIAASGQASVYRPRQYMTDVDTLKSLSYAALGKLYGQQFGDIAMAMFYLHSSLAINSRNGYAKFLLGTAHDLGGAADSAEFYAQAAYESDTVNRDYAENYAHILQKNRHGESQLQYLKKAERLLLMVAAKNEAIPADDPGRAKIAGRTALLLNENRQLQQHATATAE